MLITRLDLRRVRRFDDTRFEPGPGLNLITGDNGAGKTSVLEALHLMAYGRSFRGRVRDGLVQAGAEALEVFVQWQRADREHRAGLRHSGQIWEARLDGEKVGQLGELCAALAVVTFEPGSHALITGGGETRRRFADWGLFHVEPAFLAVWRRYARALKQRNALLKARVRDYQLDAWDQELAQTGEQVGRHRQLYLEALTPAVVGSARDLASELGIEQLVYSPGWRREEMSLADALLLARDRDLTLGYTSVGPHRADWRLEYGRLPGREALSRGQAKSTALAVLMAQAAHHAQATGEWPVVALDDLASELDREHQGRVLDLLEGSGAQVLLTGTEVPASVASRLERAHLFHVEHAQVNALKRGTTGGESLPATESE